MHANHFAPHKCYASSTSTSYLSQALPCHRWCLLHFFHYYIFSFLLRSSFYHSSPWFRFYFSRFRYFLFTLLFSQILMSENLQVIEARCPPLRQTDRPRPAQSPRTTRMPKRSARREASHPGSDTNTSSRAGADLQTTDQTRLQSRDSSSLPAHAQSTTPHIRLVEPASPSSEPRVVLPTTGHVDVDQEVQNQHSVRTHDSRSPSNASATSLRVPPLPTSRVAWHEYIPQELPMETVQSYIQELLVIQVDDVEESSSPSRIPLCPFILGHIQPSSRIIPHVPLYIPNCPTYIFFLLYVIREIRSNSHNDYVAVFSVIYVGHTGRRPSLIGSRTSHYFVEQVQANVTRERERARELILQAQHFFFPLQRTGV